jgi:hypothetical protein
MSNISLHVIGWSSSIILFVICIILISSCSASLSDYGYAAGGTNTSTVVGSPIVGTNTRTTFGDHHIYFGQGTAQSRFPGGEDMQGYSNPTSRTGQLVTDSKDLTSFYVFNGQITSHRNYYFEIAAEADYDYKAAKNEFSYLAFIVGAFPFPSDTKIGVKTFGLDTLYFKNVPKKAVKVKGEFECKNVPGVKPDEALYISYRIKFNPSKKQKCWAVSKCSIRKKK